MCVCCCACQTCLLWMRPDRDCQNSCSWRKPWRKPQVNFDTRSITRLANPSNATWEVEERCYLWTSTKTQILMRGWFLHDSFMEQQDTHLLQRNSFHLKEGMRGAESGSSNCFCLSILTPSKAFSAHRSHLLATLSCPWHPPMSDFSSNCLLAELIEIDVHCVLHQQHTFPSEVLKTLACVLIYMYFFCACMPSWCLQLTEIFPFSSAPSTCLFPRLLLPFHILSIRSRLQS